MTMLDEPPAPPAGFRLESPVPPPGFRLEDASPDVPDVPSSPPAPSVRDANISAPDLTPIRRTIPSGQEIEIKGGNITDLGTGKPLKYGQDVTDDDLSVSRPLSLDRELDAEHAQYNRHVTGSGTTAGQVKVDAGLVDRYTRQRYQQKVEQENPGFTPLGADKNIWLTDEEKQQLLNQFRAHNTTYENQTISQDIASGRRTPEADQIRSAIAAGEAQRQGAGGALGIEAARGISNVTGKLFVDPFRSDTVDTAMDKAISEATHQQHPIAAALGRGVGSAVAPESVGIMAATGGMGAPATVGGRIAAGAVGGAAFGAGAQSLQQAAAGEAVTPVKNAAIGAVGGGAGAAGSELSGAALSTLSKTAPGTAAALKFTAGLGTAGAVNVGIGAGVQGTKYSAEQAIADFLTGAAQHVMFGGPELVKELQAARETVRRAPMDEGKRSETLARLDWEIAIHEKNTPEEAPQPPAGFKLETPGRAAPSPQADEATVSYVDLPTSHELVKPISDVSGTNMKTDSVAFDAPPEIANRLTEITGTKKPPAPVVGASEAPGRGEAEITKPEQPKQAAPKPAINPKSRIETKPETPKATPINDFSVTEGKKERGKNAESEEIAAPKKQSTPTSPLTGLSLSEPARVDNATITAGPYKGSKGRIKGTVSSEGKASIEFTDKNHVTRTMIFKPEQWQRSENKSIGPGAAASVDPNFRAITGEHEPVPEDAPRIIKAVTSEPADAGRKATLAGRILQGVANLAENKSKAVGEAYTAAKDELARLGQRAFPALNRAEPKVSSAASALSAIPEAKAAMLDEWNSHLKAIAKANGVPLEEFKNLVGAAMSEDQLRGVRDGLLAEGDADAAKAVKTTIGGDDSPFETEQDYLDSHNDPAVQEAAAYIRQAIEPTLTDLYKSSAKWNATDENGDPVEPPVRGKDFGLHFSLNPIIEGETGSKGQKLKAGGNVRNTLEKHSILEKKATGAADSYELDLFKNLENALNKSILPGTHARFYQALQDAGLAKEGAPGDKVEFEGKPAKALDLKFNPGRKLFIRPDLAPEVEHALALNRNEKPFGRVGDFLTRIQLLSGVEAMSHIANQIPHLLTKPLAGGIVAESAARVSPALGKAVRVAENLPVLKIAGILDAVGTKAYRMAFNHLAQKEQVTSLAKAGALQAPHTGSIFNPLTWLGKSVKGLTNSMRLALDDGFRLAVDANIGVKDTEANRRDYINQAGNYHRESSATMVRWLKDSGLGPFATAGSARVASGYRVLAGFAPGIEGTFKARTLMRLNGAAQVAGVLGMVAIANYARTGKMQPAGTPVGSLYLGTNKDGKPHYEDVLDLIGGRGAMRNVGADAALKPGATADSAARQAISTNISPAMGAIPTFGIETITGVDPHGLYQLSGSEGPRSPIENAKEAARTLNPTLGGLTDPRESYGSQFGKFGPRVGQSAEDIAKAEKPDRVSTLTHALRSDPKTWPDVEAAVKKGEINLNDAARIRDASHYTSDVYEKLHKMHYEESVAALEKMTPEQRKAQALRYSPTESYTAYQMVLNRIGRAPEKDLPKPERSALLARLQKIK